MKKRINALISIAIVICIIVAPLWWLKVLLEGHLESMVQYAELFDSSGDKEHAIKDYKTAVLLDKYVILWNHNDNIPKYYSSIAGCYTDEGDLQNADKYYSKALKAYERYRADDKSGIAFTNVHAAMVSSALDDNQTALEHAYKASDYYKDNLDKEDGYIAASAFIWLANAYNNDSQYEKAVEYYELGIPLYYDSVEWGFGDEEFAKMLAVIYKGASMAYSEIGNKKQCDYYNKKYEEWTEYREITEGDLETITDYFHWLK